MKNRNYTIIVLLMLIGLSFYSCEVLEPEPSNFYELEDIKSYVTHAEGILLTAYKKLPVNHDNFLMAYASDEAVTNDQGHNVKSIVSGGWTSNVNPFETWNKSYEAIMYINSFLEEMIDYEWFWRDSTINELYKQRLYGEAIGLRAWFYFSLLQAHAGLGTDGQMLGVPIIDRVLNLSDPDDYQVPRSTFNQLVQFILTDCDSAIANLPDRYIKTNAYANDEALGEQYSNRINGMSVRLIKAKTLLYAASPAFSDGTYTYQQAAESSAEIMNMNNGLNNVNFANHGHLKFYNNENVAKRDDHPEVFWYSSRVSGNSWEANNYPPSFYGRGRTGPTQDLVNAFPNLDGTPVRESKINSADPYSGRDPRLSLYILFNGATIDHAGGVDTINTKAGSQDAMGSIDQNTTLTGYYLRKFMNFENVNLDPAVNSRSTRYYTYARYTDVLLMFAEAANEAAGPDGDIGGYNARDVIDAIRNRAGINSSFYTSILGQEDFAKLIRNERRLEMCFENQRFWDLRRWKMINEMKQPVFGVQVSANGEIYSYVKVENREYQDHQIYGPVPFTETLKYDIIQNQGW